MQALLRHLAIDQAVIAGLSMGGQIVMELYHAFPELFRAGHLPNLERPEQFNAIVDAFLASLPGRPAN